MAKIPSKFADIFLKFEESINLGYIPKIPVGSVVDKFGLNLIIGPTTDPEDIWEGSGLYPYDTFGTAPIISLASDNAGDTQDITIQGLDITGALVSQNITLNGTTRVALTTALWRVFRMENDGFVDIAGTVFCYTGAGAVPSVGDPEVRALIVNGNNQTQMALYTIPLGKVGYLYSGELGLQFSAGFLGGSEFARAEYQSRRVNKVFKVKKTVTLSSDGASIYQDRRVFPDAIPALTDIKLTCKEVSATMGLWGTLCILLVDEDEVFDDVLKAIGQPE